MLDAPGNQARDFLCSRISFFGRAADAFRRAPSFFRGSDCDRALLAFGRGALEQESTSSLSIPICAAISLRLLKTNRLLDLVMSFAASYNPSRSAIRMYCVAFPFISAKMSAPAQ